jgi:hypothetical protein
MVGQGRKEGMQDPRYDSLEQRVRKLEQYSEPITIPRIELDPGGIQSRLDNHAELLKEVSAKQDELFDRQNDLDDLAIKTFNEVAKVNTEVGMIKHALERQEKRFDAIAEVQKLILERLPEQK